MNAPALRGLFYRCRSELLEPLVADSLRATSIQTRQIREFQTTFARTCQPSSRGALRATAVLQLKA